MLLELLSVIEKGVMLIIPLFLCCLVIKFIFTAVTNYKKEIDYIKHLKELFCMVLTFFVVFSIMLMIMLNVYQVSLIFSNLEIEQYVLSIIYIGVEFVWQMIGLALLVFIWKYIPNTKLISGNGNLRERINNKLLILKVKNNEGSSRSNDS